MNIEEILGEGLTSVVTKVTLDEESVALKRFREDYSIDDRRNEINILEDLNHPNVVKMLQFDSD